MDNFYNRRVVVDVVVVVVVQTLPHICFHRNVHTQIAHNHTHTQKTHKFHARLVAFCLSVLSVRQFAGCVFFLYCCASRYICSTCWCTCESFATNYAKLICYAYTVLCVVRVGVNDARVSSFRFVSIEQLRFAKVPTITMRNLCTSSIQTHSIVSCTQSIPEKKTPLPSSIIRAIFVCRTYNCTFRNPLESLHPTDTANPTIQSIPKNILRYSLDENAP